MPQSRPIIWADTKAYTPLALRESNLDDNIIYIITCISLPGVAYGSNAEYQQHQLLHCQTIMQCMMLNADIRKGERGLVKCGHLRTGEGLKRVIFADVLFGRPLKAKLIRASRIRLNGHGDSPHFCLTPTGTLTHKVPIQSHCAQRFIY